jgi:ATP-binding cassette subfamily F protein 3
MIRLDGVTLRRGAKVVLDRADLVVHPGEKTGIVGPNGAGKSSLFGLLLGTLHEDHGAFHLPSAWRIASVAQQTPDSPLDAVEFVLQGDRALQAARTAITAAERDGDGEALAHAQEAFDLAGGYSARARAQALLGGLGFRAEEFGLAVNSFSGGWRMRLALAQTLMAPSDLLLLDEPTNHLDLDALVWLEQWLKRYEGTLLVISHDREFLDAVTRHTVLVEGGKLTRYSGNYTAYEEQRAAQLAQAASAYKAQQEEIARLSRFVERFRAKATKARQAQSRAKALEKIERLAPVYLAAPLRFDFLEPEKVPQQPVVLQQVDCGYAHAAVLHGVQRSVVAGSRIGVLGANGQGKSTLVKTIAGVLAPLGGELRYGKDVAIGYFAQHELDVLRPDESALQHMSRLAREIAPQAREQELRNWLGRFQFAGDMVHQPVGEFSGGEKARLVLAMIVWQRPNLLLLDEPTNHLDMQTREALTLALAQYEGAMLLVSHDRALLRAVCDSFWLVAGGTVSDFDGDLDEYQRWIIDQRRDASAAARQPQDAVRGPRAAAFKSRDDKRRQAEQRQRAAAVRRPHAEAIAAIEQRLAALEPQLKAIEAELADAATYAALGADELSAKLRQAGALRAEAEALEAQWLECQARLDALDAASAQD